VVGPPEVCNFCGPDKSFHGAKVWGWAPFLSRSGDAPLRPALDPPLVYIARSWPAGSTAPRS